MSDGQAIPLHDLAAERIVLGGILLENRGLDLVRRLGLKPRSFFQDAHAVIFEAMLELDAEQQPIDSITLRARVEAAGKFKRVGGDEYLLSLHDTIPTLANIEAHARILLGKHALREVRKTMLRGAASAEKGELEDAHEAARQVLDIRAEKKRALVYGLSDVVRAAVDSARCSTRGSIRTGFRLLDDIIDPLAPGECMVIGGRSGCGKSHTALQVALRAAFAGHVVGVVSVEDPKRRWGARAGAALHSGLTTKLLTSAQLNFDQQERLQKAFSKAESVRFHYVDAHRGGLDGVLSGIDALLELGCELIVVDHLHAIVVALQKGETTAGATNRAVNEIKGRTVAGNAVLVLVAQLGRDKQGRAFAEPTMADLRETTQIEIAADVALLSWKMSDTTGAKIIGKVAKLKDGERRDRYELVFAENGSLSELVPWVSPEEYVEKHGGKTFRSGRSSSNGSART